MLIKIILLLLFFGSMIAVGLYARKSANSMTDFVLGGRSVGPWLSAFAYGTSYFPLLYLSAMRDSLDGSTVLLPLGLVWEMR